MNQVTKVTFTFPNGNTETFDTIGFVGAFTMNQNERGATMGGFATGQFTPASIVGLATAAIEAVAKEMMNQGMPPQAVEDALLQIVPHAVESAAIREIDKRMEQLEKAGDPMYEAIQQLLTMALR